MAQSAAQGNRFAHVLLDQVDQSVLGDAQLVRGLKREMIAHCRAHHIPQKLIVPYTTRWGYGFLIAGPTPYGVHPNTITLLTTRGWVDCPLKLGAWGYKTQCLDVAVNIPGGTTAGLGLVLDAIATDYPEGTPTCSMAKALTEVVRLVLDSRAHRRSLVDGRAIDEALALHLNPHIRAWLGQED
ncbi:hypothetical protein ACIBG8_07565 [Nonomuraea sp. NPDC050556]|uniref:hypothetical protein n=1 Tax=Nonomuraea sp. NPDC050556 TaxID=3364369 RepID=UPI0037A4E6C5